MSVLGEDVGGLARREVVEHNHLIALMEESLCKVGADKSCSSCDEYFFSHFIVVCSILDEIRFGDFVESLKLAMSRFVFGDQLLEHFYSLKDFHPLW